MYCAEMTRRRVDQLAHLQGMDSPAHSDMLVPLRGPKVAKGETAPHSRRRERSPSTLGVRLSSGPFSFPSAHRQLFVLEGIEIGHLMTDQHIRVFTGQDEF
jgi:hypothetical protein